MRGTAHAFVTFATFVQDLLRLKSWRPSDNTLSSVVIRARLASLTCCGFILIGHAAAAATLHQTARAMFEDGVGQHVRLSDDGAALVLERGDLIEDDGPAAGYSYKPNTDDLAGGARARKDLLVADPRADGAHLLVGSRTVLQIEVNGHALPAGSDTVFAPYGRTYTVDPAFLVPGRNVCVLRGQGKLSIARADEYAAGSPDGAGHPNRSARSTDGGQTWDYEHLGTNGTIDGEYYVRLWLDHYRPEGTLTLGVMDLGNPEGRPVAPPVAAPGPVRIRVDADPGRHGTVSLRARSGSTYVPDPACWSAWQTLNDRDRAHWTPTGRYAQLEVTLRTDDPRATPRLKGVTVDSTAPDPGWTRMLRALETNNETIVRSGVPFAYEPLDHPRLAEFRRAFQLDNVVRGAADELDEVQRLAAWCSRQWTKGHLTKAYPPFDALEILKLHADGTPVGGFCQQNNVVLLQACLSLGIIARNVSIGPGDTGGRIRGGHEVAEVWSNRYRKWVFVDGQVAWRFVDDATGVPLSLLDLHERQVIKLQGMEPPPVRCLLPTEGRTRTWTSLLDWPPFVELRLIPRNNYLQQSGPLPLNQGMHDWFWTGHRVWDDPLRPPRRLYGHRLARRGDWEWTLNQAHYELEATARAGELRVHLDTETPGFDTFQARIDGADPHAVTNRFLWPLHTGTNTLEVWPRNVAGRNGITSRAAIAWTGAVPE